MENNYGALRIWSMVLTIIGVVSVLFVVIGVIIAVFQASSFADALVILFIVGPFGALIATWPIALAQALKAIADVAEYVRAQQTRP
jgi:ABC-type siderophore export system fused ATPase/permease subunit